MSLEAGKWYDLMVAREVSPHGYFLTDGVQDVLLHYSEKVGEVPVGEEIEVFLFYDSEDRLAATMREPLIQLGEVALLEVVDVHRKLGCFLEMGLGRHLMLPFREQPELPELRPQVGDKVFVTLGHDKQGRLIARSAKEQDLKPLCFDAPESWKNKTVKGRVYKALQMGTFLVLDGGVVGFGVIGMIHSSERTHLLRVGEEVEVRVSYVREDGNANCTMRSNKQVGRNEDADRILDFLKERPNGAMPYSDETPADVILQRFRISKSAFKRAIGKLMREGLVYQQGSWTHLKQDGQPQVQSE